MKKLAITNLKLITKKIPHIRVGFSNL